MQHVGLSSTRPLFATEFMTGFERKRSGAGQNSGGAVSGSHKNRAERKRGAAERERSGERRSEKSGLTRSGRTSRSAPLTCSALD